MPYDRPLKRGNCLPGFEDIFGSEMDVLCFERAARAAGFVRVAGLDEAGRGPLAGPVVAAAVVLPEGLLISGVKDSKEVPEQERERLYEIITQNALAFGIGIVDEKTIDKVNIYQASIMAMEKALEAVSPAPDYLLIDALPLSNVPIPQKAIIKGDRLSHSIAAASILAKTARDRMMRELHERFPEYNFRKHKGYATREHIELLKKYGPCPAHRRSFQPVAEMLREAGQ